MEKEGCACGGYKEDMYILWLWWAHRILDIMRLCSRFYHKRNSPIEWTQCKTCSTIIQKINKIPTIPFFVWKECFMITLLWRCGKRGGGREKVDRNSSLCWGWFNYKLYIIFLKNSLISFKVNKKCVGDFPHKLFVCFGKANPHGFVLNWHEFPPLVRPIFGKPLDSVPHRQEMHPTHAL